MPDKQAEESLRESVLDEAERCEARRLVWGLVDGWLTADEIHSFLAPMLTKAMAASTALRYTSESAVLEDLVAEGILHRTPGGEGYRTRMAEAIRLFSKLRQLFPKHDQGTAWISAPTLVADFRFLWRRRRYPRREIAPKRAAETIGSDLDPDGQLLGVVTKRLGSMPPSYVLSEFQVRATARILRGLESDTPHATLVTAGTGSGKTLAFYLPALSWVTKNLLAGESGRVQVVAIYPRTELLKDQFSQVFTQARAFDAELRNCGRRPIRIAALYGDVPRAARSLEYLEADGRTKWDTVANGFRCPYLRCAVPNCGGDLVWRTEDRTTGTERLQCTKCHALVSDGEIVLTRNRMEREPPDVLFVTSEMLNRSLSDSRNVHLFGIGSRASRGPDLVLLDEVHLYGGAFGAQIGFLIRRWRARMKSPAHFVGLSATLRDGTEFFSRLVGMREDLVSEIAPHERDMVPEGAEYLLALRGDPVSRRALLSTTIQAMMLAARVLDPRVVAEQRSFFGWRTFLFTDQMDSVNRLLAKGRDAEGRYEDSGNPNIRDYPSGGLARLRHSRGSKARYLGGQDWGFIEDSIGHQLGHRLQISRTTASDRGVNSDSEIVLATAALEVGYDDPSVGAVIQHKAPRDIASFLQRKGRAGRTRGTRPWTIVVLSDYGRDRLSYQGYEHLFDPELPPRNLPLGNRYIQRIQAVYGLVDYLSELLPAGTPPGSVWDDLTGPVQLEYEANAGELESLWRKHVKSTPLRYPDRNRVHLAIKQEVTDLRIISWLYKRERRELLVEALRGLTVDPAKLDECSRTIRSWLGLSARDLQSILWDYPRPLALAVVPTALRRLATDWRAVREERSDYRGKGPLADFAPAQLFSDLNLPEVELLTPNIRAGRVGLPRSNFLGVQQALVEFAPGKVSWRYDQPLWIAPTNIDASQHEIELNVEGVFQFDVFEPFPVVTGNESRLYTALRPKKMTLQQVPSLTFQDTSNARLVWHTQFVARAGALEFQAPQQSSLSSIVSRVRFHSHGMNSPIVVRRYASSSSAALRRPKVAESQDILMRFSMGGEPCVVGFEFDADAVALEIAMPSSISAAISNRPDVLRAIRVARFNDEIRNGPVLAAIVSNPFKREWLGSVFLAAASLDAIAQCRPLQLACRAVSQMTASVTGDAVLEAIFQSPIEDDTQNGVGDSEDKLRQDLSQSLRDPQVMEALLAVAARLWEAVDESWDPWLLGVARATLGGAFLYAFGSLCPDIDLDGILVDAEVGPRNQSDPYLQVPRDQELWFSEVSPGGNGLLESVIGKFIESPSRLFELAEAALGANDHETTDQQLQRVLHSIGGQSPDAALKAAVNSVRRAATTEVLDTEFANLRRQLADRGYSIFHGFAAALSARLLRPGTPTGLDGFLNDLLGRWKASEEHLGIEVDNRIIAFLVSEDDSFDQLLSGVGLDPPATNRRSWRFNAIYSLLWAKGSVIREASVRTYNPYGTVPAAPERLLISALLAPPDPPIEIQESDWPMQLSESLAKRGAAVIAVDAGDFPGIARAIRRGILEPVSTDYLNVYPRLSRVTRDEGRVFLRLEVNHPL